MLTTIKQECSTVVKSYASVAKSSTYGINNMKGIKQAVKVVPKKSLPINKDKIQTSIVNMKMLKNPHM